MWYWGMWARGREGGGCIGYRKLMTLCTLHNYYAPVWLPESDEIMHPAQLL